MRFSDKMRGWILVNSLLMLLFAAGSAQAVQMGGSIQGTALNLTSSNAAVTTLSGTGAGLAR